MAEKQFNNLKIFIMKKIVYVLTFCLLLVLSSCSIGKHLASPVYVYIDGVNNISQSSKSTKYIDKYTQEQYLKRFNSELVEALKSYNLIAVYSVPNTSEKYFKIDITSFLMRETYEPKEVPPSEKGSSPKVYNLTTCSVELEYTVYKSSSDGWQFIRTKSASASKVEKVNNNRTAAQILSGSNKDNSIYTYHELNWTVFDEIVRKTARNVAEVSSAFIDTQIKQKNY